MIAQPFTYSAPTNVAGAVELLATDPEGTRVLGGGTWVVPDLNRGIIAARHVVDLRRAGLSGIQESDGIVRVGATVTYAGLLASPVVRRRAPLLQEMAAGITGGRQITLHGTIGGSAAAARPQSDVPAVLVSLEADVLVLGPDGERRLSAADLFVTAMGTSLQPGEIITAFELGTAREAAHGYVKLKRGGSSWPIATASAQLALDERGRCTDVSLVLGGVAATPVRVDLTADLLDEVATDEALAAAARTAARSVPEPWGDVLASARYRAAVVEPVARRALQRAATSRPSTTLPEH
jgi:CO/xanthine dehydrogenase FAD-binding subunit